MKLFTRGEIRELGRMEGGTRLTIMMPIHPAGDQWMEDPVRLGNLLRDAEQRMRSMGVGMLQVQAILEPLRQMRKEPMTWRQSGQGLAIFVGPDHSRVFRVPLPLPELMQVADVFHLKPLVKLFQGNGYFYVLAIGAKGHRLLQCTRHGQTEVAVPGAPENLEEANRYLEDPLGRSAFHSHRLPHGGGGTPDAWPQGFGEEDRRKMAFMEYFRQLDIALARLLATEQAPLVYAGIEERLPLYRMVSSYSHLVDHGVYGNPQQVHEQELRERAWKLVEPHYTQGITQAAERCRVVAYDPLGSSDLPLVLQAAHHGRVEILFFAEDEEVWGRVDQEAWHVEINGPESRDGDVDLLNDAVLQTLLNGGEVYGVPRDELPNPDGGAVNAVFRW